MTARTKIMEANPRDSRRGVHGDTGTPDNADGPERCAFRTVPMQCTQCDVLKGIGGVVAIDEVLWRATGWMAAAVFIAAVLGFGAALPGYAQGTHPVALLGAQGVAHAGVFNLLAFELVGVLALAVAARVLSRMPARPGWPLRIGGQLIVLAGLAFFGMGALPLNPLDLDDRASQYHATAWLLWGVAFVPGTLLLASDLLNRDGMRVLAWITLGAGLVVAVACFGPPALLPQAIAQRVAFLGWVGWLALAAWCWPAKAEQAF